MKKIPSLLIILMSVLAFASCGESHEAKGQVKEFMANAMGLKDYDVIAWSSIDSTSHVTDSMLTVMHKKAVQDKIVKGNPAYAKRTQKMGIITVAYSVNNDTVQNTFYLADKQQGIVGVKKDVFNHQ